VIDWPLAVDPEALGVYVHVPFCRRRCDYCAFATYVDRDHLMADYVSALRTEIATALDEGRLGPASAIYVGGGTPSRLPPEELASVVAAIPRRPGAEVSVECNPEDVTEGALGTYRQAGVTRVSLGAQAVADHVLNSLGRHHRFEAVVAAAGKLSAAGLASWNLDLIFGAVAERDEDWATALAVALHLNPPHLSAYALTVEPGTPLAADPTRYPDDDIQARRYELADAVLSAAGYRWEEISNWAKPGHHCLYNNITWWGGDYLGFGAAAHSHRGRARWWNVRRPERYIALIRSGAPPVAASEALTERQQALETLVLSLRTPRGVPSAALAPTEDLVGLVEWRDDRAVLTVPGRLLASEVSLRLRLDGAPRLLASAR